MFRLRLNMTRKGKKATKELRIQKTNQLFKIDDGLLMFLPFFMVGVTLSGNDYYKKG